jgi:uncharacterized iron-regulated membrane protein
LWRGTGVCRRYSEYGGGGAVLPPNVLWRVEMHDLLQHLHRGSIVGIPGQVIDVLTGTILTVDELLDQQSFAEPTMNRVGGAGAAPTAVRVQIRMRDGQPQAVVTIDAVGAVPTTLTFNAATGAQLLNAPAPPAGASRRAPGDPPSFNALMQSFHGGSIAGKAGEWFILLTGAFFVVLSITGIWMYFQLRGAGVKIRRSEWFW